MRETASEDVIAMLGPHFYFDLVRLARNRRNVYLRCAYLLALLFAWWLVYEKSLPFEGRLNDYARLATNFTHSLLAFQYVMIVLLAPIYLAGTIVEERESRSLELVFQTQLTDREILLGKFCARVAHLLFLVLLGLPMLSIITLWGGVNMELLAAHLGLTLLLILLVGSMCLWVSVTSATYTEAMILGYVLVGVGMYVTCPFIFAAFGGGLFAELPPLWAQCLIAIPFLFGTAFFYWNALLGLRKLRDLNWIKRVDPSPRPAPRPRRTQLPRPKRVPKPTPPVPDHALLWKETVHLRPIFDVPDAIAWLGLICVFLCALSHAICAWLMAPNNDLKGYLVFSTGVCAVGYSIAVGVTFILLSTQMTAAVARERERDTLDFLLLLPVERYEILLIKAIAPWVRYRTCVFTTLAIPLVCMFAGVFPVSTGLMLVLSPWPVLLFVNALALLLSVVCRRVVMANVILIGIGVLIFSVHLVFWSEFELMLRVYIELIFATEDPRGIDPTSRSQARWLIVAQQSAFLVLAVACWAQAFWYFSRKTARVSI